MSKKVNPPRKKYVNMKDFLYYVFVGIKIRDTVACKPATLTILYSSSCNWPFYNMRETVHSTESAGLFPLKAEQEREQLTFTFRWTFS